MSGPSAARTATSRKQTLADLRWERLAAEAAQRRPDERLTGVEWVVPAASVTVEHRSER